MARAGGIDLDLRAQALDVHVQGLGVADVIGAPHPVDELPAGEHPPAVAQEVLQEIELLQRHGHRIAVDGDDMALDVHDHAATAQDVLLQLLLLELRLAAAAQHRADAGDELAGAVRLGHVVVRADLQAHDLVDFAVAGGDHDDRHIRAQPDVLAHLGAAHARQHQVQQDDVDVIGLELRQRGRAVARDADLEPLLLQQERQGFGQGRFVFDDENGGHGWIILPSSGPAARG